MVLDENDAWCIVSLPSGAFTGDGAGVKTNLVFSNAAARQSASGFRNPHGDPLTGEDGETIELARSTDEERKSQLQRLADFQQRHAAESPALLQRLQQTVIDNGNVFAVLMDAVRCCSLGQITNALIEVGGRYRRSMKPGLTVAQDKGKVG